jgi:hypothetical protein
LEAEKNTVDSSFMLIPLGPGEVLDRLTVLQLKAQAAQTELQRSTIQLEQQLLSSEWVRRVKSPPHLAVEWEDLLSTNGQLWRLEDEVRAAERQANFGPAFIAAARSIYLTNDRRAQIKRAINERLGSAICDFKFHDDGSC